jgi:hypothetical protein
MPECRVGLQVVRRFWIKNDARGAVEAMKKMTDHSVLVDVLSVLMERTELLTLEICCMLIPLLNGLLTSDHDRYLISADFQNFVAVYMAVNAELPCVTSSSG